MKGWRTQAYPPALVPQTILKASLGFLGPALCSISLNIIREDNPRTPPPSEYRGVSKLMFLEMKSNTLANLPSDSTQIFDGVIVGSIVAEDSPVEAIARSTSDIIFYFDDEVYVKNSVPSSFCCGGRAVSLI